MRRSLSFSLAAVVVLSGIALWLPDRAVTIVQALEPGRPLPTPTAQPLQPILPLPATLEPLVIEAARRDPFGVAAPPPSQPAPPALPPPAPAAAPVVPSPPPLAWRAVGTMVTPEGQRLVLLANAAQDSVIATPGLVLDGAYEVVSVERDSVQLRHPPSGATSVISIPPPASPGG